MKLGTKECTMKGDRGNERKQDAGAGALFSKRVSRRQALKGAAALGLAAPVAGAGLGRGRVAAADRTKVTAMGVTVDPQRGLDLWKLWKQAIEKENPDIEVEFITPVPGISTEKLLTMVATGAAPDVIQASNLEYAARGLLVDLTPFIERDKILDRPYFKKSVDAVKYVDKFYAMPGGISTYVFWVNLNELTEAGYELPSDGVFTFDEFDEIAKKVTIMGSDGKVTQWAYGTDTWFSRMPPLIWARGGDLFEYDEKTLLATKSTFNSQPVIDAIQWNADLITKEKVSPKNASEAEKAGFDFYSGKVTFNYGGNWIISDGREKIAGKFKWSPMRVLVAKKGDQPLEMAPAFNRGSILNSAKDKEAAWKVLKYMSGPEANELYREYVTDEIIYDTPDFRNRFVAGTEPENADRIITVAEEAGKRPLNKSEVRVLYGWTRMTNIMANELASVYEGSKQAADVTESIEKQLNDIINEGKSQGFDPANPPDALKKA
jgi:multiple sugar transport system substrate-binding protein